jgi:dimethylamine monooxygenase subunit A
MVAAMSFDFDAAEHLARLVTGTERWERFVWTITRHPRLHAHPAHVDPGPRPEGIDGGALAQRAWWCTERWERFVWTITRHPRLHAHPAHVDPGPRPEGIDGGALAQRAWWCTERQTFIPLVHDALEPMSQAVLDCRGLRPVRERLLRWLARRAAA